MSHFRRLDSVTWASPQIGGDDLAEAARRGFSMVVNNRPDGESDKQPTNAQVAEAAQQAGLAYRFIPVDHAGFSSAQIDEMRRALDDADGAVLAYCRSGTRSTMLWALAQAKAGTDSEELAAAASAAGYDLSPIRAVLDILAQQERN